MGTDQGPQPVAGVSRLLSECPSEGEFFPGEAAARGRDLGQYLGVALQILLRNPQLRHASPEFLTRR
jgi:hypothetical protein